MKVDVVSNIICFFILILRGFAVVMIFWLGVRVSYRVRVGVKFRFRLTLSLKLTLTIPNQNLTYFGVRPLTLDVIVTGKKKQKNTGRTSLSSISRVTR